MRSDVIKLCSSCFVEKPLDQFYVDGGKPTARCKDCKKSWQKEWRNRNGASYKRPQSDLASLPPSPKECSTCGVCKPPEEFYKSRYKQTRCRDCHRGYQRKWNRANPDSSKNTWKQRNPARSQAMDRDCNRRLRLKVLAAYGNSCACCGESRYEFLAIDHINGGGRKHRQEAGNSRAVYKFLADNDYPEGFRVLCHNCNLSIGFYGFCPHKSERILLAEACDTIERVER